MFAATPSLRAGYPGFFRRSMDELKRQAKFAVKMEGLHIPIKPFPLIKFDEPLSPERCKMMCDSDVGGFSRASLTYVPGAAHVERTAGEGSDIKKGGVIVNAPAHEGEEPSHAVFAGSISTELPPNRPQIQRSGYAGFRTRDRGMSLFGKLLWDLSPYSYLALRIKSDGRKYFVNFQTESIVPTDLHQHLLPSYSPGEWETVTIPFSALVRTNYGQVVEPQKEMMSTKVRSVGISLIDRVPGPFELKIADIYATNRPPERKAGQEETGFDLSFEPEDEDAGRGMMDEIEPRRKKGEPERILI
ncbi:Putative complex I intermediate-associated protein 30 [Septoria linicola]|uniref:Complex I intermediate-associated protein 30 n=1 Tax=Septoria linicola TaxID=215465 RepID=A0A9Q9EHX2_9PEZI|nr:putative complex I intermediate-associated protein 30 [Septoria linicola]USW50474.1 Putative complex I intermediate-associated protein 30 [Septoria linicola]